MVDRLATLLNHFTVTAQVFHAGALCGSHRVPAEEETGQLHLIRQGLITVFHGNEKLTIERPSLLFYPRPLAHRFETDPITGADMVCANVVFEGGVNNAICNALPEVVCIALEDIADASAVLSVLFDEAFAQRCGRTAVLNRLFEVVVIQILRDLMEHHELHAGMLAGLAHPRLRLALVAMHESPANAWSLEELGTVCGMSRSVFANSFRDTVGCTPGVYLQHWRLSMAQRLLREGQSLQHIAEAVGYGSETAFSRAFRAQWGTPPRQWLQKQKTTH